MLPYLLLLFITALFAIILLLVRKSHQKALTKAVNEAYSAGGKTAVETSRRVIKGKVSEELFPLMSGCPYVASDMKFMGQPIDYLVVVGYTDVRDGDKEDIEEIVFMDIKTGKAQLSKYQRKIKEAVLAKRVAWATVRIKDGVFEVKREAGDDIQVVESK